MLDKANSSRPENAVRHSQRISSPASISALQPSARFALLMKAASKNMALVAPSSGLGDHQMIDAFLV